MNEECEPNGCKDKDYEEWCLACKIRWAIWFGRAY